MQCKGSAAHFVIGRKVWLKWTQSIQVDFLEAILLILMRYEILFFYCSNVDVTWQDVNNVVQLINTAGDTERISHLNEWNCEMKREEERVIRMTQSRASMSFIQTFIVKLFR